MSKWRYKLLPKPDPDEPPPPLWSQILFWLTLAAMIGFGIWMYYNP